MTSSSIIQPGDVLVVRHTNAAGVPTERILHYWRVIEVDARKDYLSARCIKDLRTPHLDGGNMRHIINEVQQGSLSVVLGEVAGGAIQIERVNALQILKERYASKV